LGPESNETEPSAGPEEAAVAKPPEASPPASETPPAATAPSDAVHGGEPAFRVVGLQCEWLAEPHPEGLEGAVSAELGLRVQRLAQSVDAALVLTDEGVVRFLGEPIGRLVRGEETLNPKVLVLADSRLSDVEKTTAQARIEAWVVQHFRKTLGPVLELYGLDSENESLKALAERLVKGLGIVERVKVQREVRALDQPARAVLREKGVRFGSYYIFLPAMLKPGARKLSATLWERTSGVAMFEGPRAALAAGASAGRTSLGVEAGIAPADCQMFGYRLCGERAVRIDIVERLADLIRAQLAPPKGAPEGTPRPQGFAVLPQMTSMSGCSHEQFADVLRALGYESFEATVEVAKPEAAPAAEAPVAEDAPPPETEAAEVHDLEALDGVHADVAAEPVAEAETHSVAEPAEATPSEAVAQAPAEAAPETKTVELWRLAQRQSQPRPPRREARTPREWTIPAQAPRPERPPQAQAPASEETAPGAERPRGERPPRGERRNESPRPVRAQEERSAPRPPKPAPVIDKDSPFYKLMALREQLTKK